MKFKHIFCASTATILLPILFAMAYVGTASHLEIGGFIEQPSVDDLVKPLSSLRIAVDSDSLVRAGRVLHQFEVDGSVQVNSFSEFKKAIDDLIAKRFHVNDLKILSHGSNKSINLAGTMITSENIDSDMMRLVFEKLSQILSEDATLTFEGCSIGLAQDLIRKISDFTDRRVVGFTAGQNFGPYRGRKVLCHHNHCTTEEGFSIWESLEEIWYSYIEGRPLTFRS